MDIIGGLLGRLGSKFSLPFVYGLCSHKSNRVGFGNIGGIIATYAFISTDAVNFYHMGYSICLGFICLSAASCCIYAFAVVTQNRKRDRMTTNVGLTEYEKTELGDLSPDYRYLL